MAKPISSSTSASCSSSPAASSSSSSSSASASSPSSSPSSLSPSSLPFEFVLSLGSSCLCAKLLSAKWRQFSTPLDWMFSSSAMITSCLRDDWKEFLDRTQYTKEIEGCGHRVYSPLLGKKAIFLHRNPMEDEQYEYYQRCVQRFRSACTRRVLFVLVHTSRKPSSNTQWIESMRDLFAVLQQHCVSFELLAVRLVKENVPPLSGTGQGSTRLTVAFLPCNGRQNGASFEDSRDQNNFEDLVKNLHSGDERQFALAGVFEDFTQKPITAAHSLGVGHGHGLLHLRETVFRRLETNFGFAFDVCGICAGDKGIQGVRSWWHPAEEDAKKVLLSLSMGNQAVILLPEDCLADPETPTATFHCVMRWKPGSKLFRDPPNSTKVLRTSKCWVLLATFCPPSRSRPVIHVNQA